MLSIYCEVYYVLLKDVLKCLPVNVKHAFNVMFFALNISYKYNSVT